MWTFEVYKLVDGLVEDNPIKQQSLNILTHLSPNNRTTFATSHLLNNLNHNIIKMFSSTVLSVTAVLLACSSFAAAAPQGKTSEVSLTTKLRLAETYVMRSELSYQVIANPYQSFIDRYSLLPEDKDFLFSFNSTPSAMANSQTFPALTGSGVSLASAQIPGIYSSFSLLNLGC